MRVLVADDDEICREVVAHRLTTAGYSVLEAADGNEARDHLLLGHAQLAILDWDMPGCTGVDLCRMIRESETDHYIYLILLTARNSTDSALEGLTAGADAFVTKPISGSELLARVHGAERILSMETRDVAIFALARLAESRDTETGEHLERVRNYSRMLAQHLCQHPDFRNRIDTSFIRLIYSTSPLHDIGKVGIPDAVLLKPGKLTKEEFAIMQRHTTIGAETLEAACRKFPQAEFLHMAKEIAAWHHERWNGSGYPDGLEGEEIPLAARIVSVADVYDALTTKRVYKEAFPHEEAIRLIVEGRGTQFDPRIVDAFLQLSDRFNTIRERLSDTAPNSARTESHLGALSVER